MRNSFAALSPILLLAFVVTPFACAESVGSSPTSGTGGEAGGTNAGGEGGGDGGMGPCIYADDCAFMADSCNAGTCINGACQKTPANENGPCDDGKQCTTNDHCEAGLCTGPLKSCSDVNPGDVCHISTCDVETDTCVSVPGNDGAGCIDQDACTLTSVCSGGACVGQQLVDCSFLDSECGIGVCDAASLGCVAMPKNDGDSCDDGAFCTINDSCQGGQCKGEVNTCTAVGDTCNVGSCDEINNKCNVVPGNNGGACSDGNDCTAGETCLNGTCLGGQAANNGGACDDQNGCTSGTTCSNGVCGNAGSTISQCIDGDMCCPPGCAADADCLFWQSGILQNVLESDLTGWTQCFSDDYGNYNTPFTTIVSQCDKAKLLIGCKPTGTQTLTLAAMADRNDVLFDCGQQANCTHLANGVGFYYSDTWSWGFAPSNVGVNRNSCDVGDGSGGDDQRMCWHSWGGFINGGYRCGNNYPFDSSWTRVVFEAD